MGASLFKVPADSSVVGCGDTMIIHHNHVEHCGSSNHGEMRNAYKIVVGNPMRRSYCSWKTRRR
jgi:hypothetical protein